MYIYEYVYILVFRYDYDASVVSKKVYKIANKIKLTRIIDLVYILRLGLPSTTKRVVVVFSFCQSSTIEYAVSSSINF